MKDYVIVTDSTTDLPADLVEQFRLSVVPLSYTIGDNTYLNNIEKPQLDTKEFYKKLRAGETSVTSQVNLATFLACFEGILQSGKNILYIGFSSHLSGTFQSGYMAARELQQKYPTAKISCVDSQGASLGEGLLVYLAAKKKEEGLSLEELEQWILENRSKACHWFTVDDLNHLKRGGRVSAVSAFFGTALDIKPILHVDDQGRLVPTHKVRGRTKAIKALVEQMDKTCINPEEQTVFIGHGDCLEEAKQLEKLIREKLPVKDVLIHPVGPVIGSHTGPGVMALFFLGNPK